MRFDSQWCDTIEMVFEGVTAFNLRPAGDNYTSGISAAHSFQKMHPYSFVTMGLKRGMKIMKVLG